MLRPLDDVRDGERLARAGDAEQDLVPLACARPAHELLDRLRLVALGLEAACAGENGTASDRRTIAALESARKGCDAGGVRALREGTGCNGFTALPSALLSSSLSWPLALSDCATTDDREDPRNGTTEDAATRAFARDDYCPMDRVSAKRLVPMAPPPRSIASDPERLALWQQEWDLRARTDTRLIVEVTGCGTRFTYSCWEYLTQSGVRTTGRGQRRDVSGAVCLPENGYVSSESGR